MFDVRTIALSMPLFNLQFLSDTTLMDYTPTLGYPLSFLHCCFAAYTDPPMILCSSESLPFECEILVELFVCFQIMFVETESKLNHLQTQYGFQDSDVSHLSSR